MGDETLAPLQAESAPVTESFPMGVVNEEEPVTETARNGRAWKAGHMGVSEPEWDMEIHGKHSVGLQPMMGVLRNNRTPLNTPYTPQLVKLHLDRHDEYEKAEQAAATRPGKHLATAIKGKIAQLGYLIRRIRYKALQLALNYHSTPMAYLDANNIQLFVQFQSREWITWYFTTVICIPFVLLLSPMVIAFTLLTSPIWLAGVTVLVIRRLVPSANHSQLTADNYSRSPHGSLHHNGASDHHPNSVYRRANLTNGHISG